MDSMNDFDYEVMQKKRLVNQSRGTIKGKKKRFSVNMPSDYMTKKEIEKMNGDLKVWRDYDEAPTFPIPWNVFKRMSVDAQKKYLEHLQTVYGASLKTISEMLGVHYMTLSKKCAEIGYHVPRNLRLIEGAWAEFMSCGKEEPKAEEPVAEKTVETPATGILTEEDAILAMFRTLKGTGAKITIEVTL